MEDYEQLKIENEELKSLNEKLAKLALDEFSSLIASGVGWENGEIKIGDYKERLIELGVLIK